MPDDSVVETLDLVPTGPGTLVGVTFAAKEIFEVAGHPRRTGSSIVLPDVAAQDAEAISLLRAAGARLTARSTSHEFAWGITNRRADGSGTANPLLPGRISGGSSGGSAALVASGAVDLGLGSDTAGSCRIPAAFCGILGWKATNGLVPMNGCLPLAPSFDCGGLMARSVRGLRAGAGVLGGDAHPGRSADSNESLGARVAVLDSNGWRLVDDERRRAHDAIASRLNADVVADLPQPVEIFEAFGVLQASEVLHAHRDVLGIWPAESDRYPGFVRERLRAAESRPDAQVDRARSTHERLLAAFDELWDAADVLLTVLPCGPTSVDSPDTVTTPDGPRALRDVLVPWTCLANMAGCPAVVVPVGRDETGAPIAVQLMSAPGTDLALIERLGEWFGDTPGVSCSPRE